MGNTLRRFNMERSGLRLSFFGPSGSGKSTCFRMAEDAIRERVGGHMTVYRADVAKPLREIQLAAHQRMGLADLRQSAEDMPQDGRLLSLLASHFEPHLGLACCSFVDSASQAHPARDAAFVNTDCRNNAYGALHDFGFWFARVEADADTVRGRVARRGDSSPYDASAAVEQIDRIEPHWTLHNNGTLDELREAVGRVVQAAIFMREEFLAA